MKIENDKLVDRENTIEQLNCPKNKAKFGSGLPDTIVIHYTAGRSGESSAAYLCKDHVKASAHIVVDISGKIFQLVPFNTIAWHAGPSSHNGRTGLNKYSIGIEIDNAGVLEKSGAVYRSWFGKTYDESEVVFARHRNESEKRYWHAYSEVQILRVFDICEALMNHFNISHIVGHEEISPGRKQDPGPAFPLDKLREDLIRPRWEDSGDKSNGMVEASFLNIREMPDLNSEKVSNPLPQGTELQILQERQGWYYVKTQIEGWVASDYVSVKS